MDDPVKTDARIVEMARLALFVCLSAVLETHMTESLLTNDIKGVNSIQQMQTTANASFTKSPPRNDLNEISEFRTTTASVLSTKSPTESPILQERERDKTQDKQLGKHLHGVKKSVS